MERTLRFRHPFLPAALIVGLLSVAGARGAAFAGDKVATTKSTPKSEAKAVPATPAESAKPPAGQPSRDEMMAMMMKAASPGPEHAALNPLAGTWKLVTKMWSDPAGEPMIGEGTCERNWVLGGRYLLASYKGIFGDMPFEGMEMLGYDNTKKQYVSSWIDNMGTGIMMSHGTAMDPTTKSFTLTGSFLDPTGKDTAMREVTSIVDGNTYTMTVFSNESGKEAKSMEITYTRLK